MGPRNRFLRFCESALVHVVLYVIAILMIIPFLWMLDTALKSSSQIYHIPVIWWPHPFAWGNFRSSWTDAPFGRFYVNTIWVSIATTILQALTSILAGYALARMKFFGRHFMFMAALATMMVPFQVIAIPEFLIMKHVHLIDHLWALVLPNVANGFSIFLLRQFFLQIPVEMEESAAIDGASKFTIIFRIMVPLARPAIATLVLFAFLNSWNDYFWPLIVLSTPAHMTIQAGLGYFQGAHETQASLQMAGSLLSIIPVVILYLLTRRQLVEGIVAGAIKG